MSSASLTSRPRDRRSATGHLAPSSVSSFAACAHSIVSAIPGGLINPRLRTSETADTNDAAASSASPGTFASMIARSRAASGNSIQW